MSIKILFSFAVLLVSSMYLGFLNPYEVKLALTGTYVVKLPVVISLLISFFLGMAFIFLVNIFLTSKYAFLDFKKYLEGQRLKKINKMFVHAKNLIFRGKEEKGSYLLLKVLKNNKRHIGALKLLGDIYRKSGTLDEALRLHSRASYYEGNENIEILYTLSMDYVKLNCFLEAVSVLKEIRAIDKDSLKPLYRLREIYLLEKNHLSVFEIQKEIIRLCNAIKPINLNDEKKNLSRYYFSYAKSLKNDSASSIKYLKLALKNNNKYKSPYFLLATLYKSEDNNSEAVKVLKDGYKNTLSPAFLRELEDLFFKNKEKGKVFKMYDDAIKRDPANKILSVMHSFAYLRFDMIAESRAELEKITDNEFKTPLLNKLRARLYEKGDDLKAAIFEYKLILNNNSLNMLLFGCDKCGFYDEEIGIKCPECCR